MKILAIASLALLVGCSALQAQQPAVPTTAAPDAAKVSKLAADLMDASARASKEAATVADQNIKKLALDRVACYDTLLLHVNSFQLAGGTKPAGLFSLEEVGLEHFDAQNTGGSNIIPLDIQANCASYAAQKLGALNKILVDIANVAGLKTNVLFAPLATGASAAAAVIKAQ